jgi:hypothetical protein
MTESALAFPTMGGVGIALASSSNASSDVSVENASAAVATAASDALPARFRVGASSSTNGRRNVATA